MRRIRLGSTIAAVLIGVFALSGCGGPAQKLTAFGQIDELVFNEENEVCRTEFMVAVKNDDAKQKGAKPPITYRVKDNAIEPILVEIGRSFLGRKGNLKTKYNLLLDCVFGITTTREQALLRAHMIITLFARYAAFNITGDVGGIVNSNFVPYNEITEDAATLISRLEVAEDLLRIRAYNIDKTVYSTFKRDTSSSVTAAKLANLTFIGPVNLSYLELSILQLVFDAEKPTARRAKVAVKSIIRALVSRSPTEAKTALRAAVSGVAKIAILNRFTGAYVKSATDFAMATKATKFKWNLNPTPAHWSKWDALLVEACDRLANEAEIKSHCLTEAEMTAARKLLNGT